MIQTRPDQIRSTGLVPGHHDPPSRAHHTHALPDDGLSGRAAVTDMTEPIMAWMILLVACSLWQRRAGRRAGQGGLCLTGWLEGALLVRV